MADWLVVDSWSNVEDVEDDLSGEMKKMVYVDDAVVVYSELNWGLKTQLPTYYEIRNVTGAGSAYR